MRLTGRLLLGAGAGAMLVGAALGGGFTGTPSEAPAPSPTPGPTPTPSPITVVAADGWQATFPSPPAGFDPEGDPETVQVTRQGFDANGAAAQFAELLTVTKRIRQPYPNHANLTADQVALSDYVYAADQIVGAANNSTEVSPKPIANWAIADRRIVGNTIELEVIAFHRDGIACVEFTATDGSATVSAKVSATVVSGHAGDRNAVLVYKAALDVSGLATGTITANAKVYPRVGVAASVLDSAAVTADGRGFRQLTFLRNAAKFAAPPYAYVNAATGVDAVVDANGQAGGNTKVSTNAATAAANPFLTLKSALEALKAATTLTGGFTDGCVIRVNGTMAVVAGLLAGTYSQHAAVIVERDPAVARASAVIQFGSASSNWRHSWVHFRDVKFLRNGTSFLPTGTWLIDDCDLDAAGLGGNLMNNQMHVMGLAVSNPVSSMFYSGTHAVRMLRGVTSPLGMSLVDGWFVIGCNIPGYRGEALGRPEDSGIVAFNKLLSLGPNTPVGPGAASGFAVVENVFEWASATDGTSLRPSADAGTGNITHLVVWHNSFAGFFTKGRMNALYNDHATIARTHKLCSFKGNIHVSINTKHDVFIADGTRTGGWPYMYGVGCEDEFSQFADANGGTAGTGSTPGASFSQEFPGLGAKIGASSTIRQDPLFTNSQAATSGAAGAGGGTYTLEAGSPARGMVAQPRLSHDLAGTPRAANGAAGAYA